MLSLTQRASEIFESSEPEEKRQLLDFILQNLQLDGKKLMFKVKTPFDGVLSANTTHNWGGFVENIRTELMDVRYIPQVYPTP